VKKETLPVKKHIRDALTDFRDELHRIIEIQGLLTKIADNDSDNQIILQTRIKFFNESIGNFFNVYERLETLNSEKHAGGRPMNSLFNIAYALTKQHYQSTKKIYSAKGLTRAVNIAEYGKADFSDVEGREPFPERSAQECIRIFKLCLPYESL